MFISPYIGHLKLITQKIESGAVYQLKPFGRKLVAAVNSSVSSLLYTLICECIIGSFFLKVWVGTYILEIFITCHDEQYRHSS